MKTVLVTGVAGFLGSHIAEQCVKLDFNVVGIDDLSGGYIENIPKGVKFYKGSITDKNLLDNIWERHNIDYIYHFAAYAAEGLSHFIRRHNYEINLLGSVNLINQSILSKVKCFIFASSIAVYGTCSLPMTEESTPQPEDPYGISKYAVELDLAAANNFFGLPYIIFRLHNVYGERQNLLDKYRNVIGIFMKQVINNSPMSIFGDGLQTRAFSYVHDIVPIISIAPLVDEAYGQVFNLGADLSVSILDLTFIIAKFLGKEYKAINLPPRKEVRHAVASHEKLRRIFGAYHITSLEDGIKNMAEWVIKNPIQYQTMQPSNIEIEITNGLPQSWQNSH